MYVQIHRQAPNWTEPNRNRKTCYKLYCLVLVSVSKMKKKTVSMNCVIWQYANEIEINCSENLTEFFLGFFFLIWKNDLKKLKKMIELIIAKLMGQLMLCFWSKHFLVLSIPKIVNSFQCALCSHPW